MAIFNVIIKGDLDAVKREIETRDVDLINARLQSGCISGMVRGEGIDVTYMNSWFLNGPSTAPFRPGTLLHWAPAPNLRIAGEMLA